jgi:hypothetical protein
MPRVWARIVSSAVAVGAIALVFGCVSKPEAGKPCKQNGQLNCVDGQSSLFCDGAKWQALSCKGPKGCRKTGTSVYCDDDLAAEGDPCINPTSNENHACSTDHKAILVCRNNKFEKKRDCKGPTHCTVKAMGNDNEILCDNSVGEAGDSCITGSLSCTPDAKMKLRCVGDKFVNDNSCRGPKACHLTNNTLYCDETIAMEGDPCDTASEVTCGMDGKTELICQGGKFSKKRDCKGKDGCYIRGTTLYCAEW